MFLPIASDHWLAGLYCIITVILVIAELCYFKIADHYNIIDKPNERSSHSTVVLRGGGIIFTIAMLVWSITPFPTPTGEGCTIAMTEYWPFLIGLLLIAGVSFIDDIHSLPDSVRLVAQFTAMTLAIYPCITALPYHWTIKVVCFIIALIVFVGATNVINFMDGINGITAGYSIAVLLPLLLLNREVGFIDESYLAVAMIGVLVFCIFNFRPKGKAKCFAGDVGSVGIAFIMLFALGRLIILTEDVAWLAFMVVYGVDGCLTIIHRIMLHENLGEAHRKHAYQIMANELGMSHVVVSCIYMGLQMVISLVMVYMIPDSVLAHWIYLIAVAAVLAVAYILFMKKYYHLHEAYLESLKK